MTKLQSVNKNGLTEEQFLSQYNDNKYKKPSVTTDMVIFTIGEEEVDNCRKLPEQKLKVLMIKRGDFPFINKWALPGGFVNMNESLDESAYRELKEETNLESIYMEQLYTWGDIGRDPRTRVISTSYLALVNRDKLKTIQAGDDAIDAQWFTVDAKIINETKQLNIDDKGVDQGGTRYIRTIQLILTSKECELEHTIKIFTLVKHGVVKTWFGDCNSGDIAFDHAKILYYSLLRLRGKAEYTSIVFNLMPEMFTLTELQQAYEIILGKELLAANFRRKIADMVVVTKHQRKDKGHRPSQLFRFNEKWIERNLF